MIGSIHIHLSPSLAYIDPGGAHSTVRGKYNKVDQIVDRIDTILHDAIGGLEELTIQVDLSS